MKLDILAVGAHPDDIEMSCGATLAKEIANGKKIGLLDLTRGELGTRGTAAIRDKEAASAAKILGASFRHNLALADGFFENSAAAQLKIIEVVRKYRPDIVMCNAVQDRHIDHGKGSSLVSSACFLSGLVKIKTTHKDSPQQPWRPKHVYHYIQWNDITPHFVVDVTGFMDKKMQAIAAYKSQFYNKNSNEPETPTSSKNLWDSLRYRSQNFGRLIGTAYGEGFTTERYVAVNSVFDLI
ncbi:MAG: bacillithiol biosynthesis deacetylase BshB1 [Marinirhabdus sp.]